jgi:hypothetical protein
VHIYDGNLRTQGGCFQPGSELGTRGVRIGLDDWRLGTQDGTLDCDAVPGPNGTGTCSFDVTAQVPPSGLLYVNVHLDYGLKGNFVNANPYDLLIDRYDRGATASPWGTFDALINDTATVGIADCRDYEFGWDGPSQSYTDTVQSMNEFKGINGAFGQVINSLNGSPVANARLQLVKNSTRTVVASASTDVDGFYLLAYRHKGSPDTYTVYLLDYALVRTIELKGSGWGEVDFDVYTGTSTATYGTGK